MRRGQDEGTVCQVDIEIGRLVLDGFDRIHRDAVAATFSRELTRMLRRAAALGAADIELTSRAARLPARQLSASMPSGQLGRALADAVFRVLGDVSKETEPPASAVLPINTSGGTHGDGASLGGPSDHAALAAGAPPPRGAETAPR
jgi:hypothetical protein